MKRYRGTKAHPRLQPPQTRISINPAPNILESYQADNMGSLPKIKRRCFTPGALTVASLLSGLFLYTFLFSQPAYLEQLPDALLHPLPESDQLPSTEGTTKVGSQVDLPNSGGQAIPISQGGNAQSNEDAANAATDSAPADKTSESVGDWKFNSTRDSNTYTLSTEQCHSAFPGLFAEIERGVATRKALGTITPEQIDISSRGNGALRAMILDQQVRAMAIRCVCPCTNNAR